MDYQVYILVAMASAYIGLTFSVWALIWPASLILWMLPIYLFWIGLPVWSAVWIAISICLTAIIGYLGALLFKDLMVSKTRPRDI